jgi:ribosomal-protein-alanine N-acetyltransferase
MSLEDIPAVMDIEKASFPRPWPEKAYRYELSENPDAYFVVARIPGMTLIGAPPTASPWQRLAQRIGLITKPTVSMMDAKVVGFVGMWMYADEAHVATIATHPDWRGRGIGERILLDVLREAQRRHARQATLEVRVSNTVAQNLYRKYGFEEVGRRKSYYQDNREDALLMTVTTFDTREYRERLDALEHSLVSGS